MGTIKIEFDLPEFKDELQINVVIRKDGEVICNQVASPKPANNVELCSVKSENPLLKKAKSDVTDSDKQEKPSSTSSNKKVGGNLMGMDIF